MVKRVFILLVAATVVFACSNSPGAVVERVEEGDTTNVLTQEQKELEKIIYFESCIQTIAPLMSNDMMDVDWEDVDTLELTDRYDSLFVDLERLLKTAIIDSTLLVGEDYIDTLLCKDIWVRSDVVGYIVDDGGYIDTIPFSDVQDSGFSEDIFKDVPQNEFVKKTVPLLMQLCNGENDIPADYMLIYKYNGEVPNDTICYNRNSNVVRVNSYIATTDSLLFNSVTDTLCNRMYPICLNNAYISRWNIYINNKETDFWRYLKNDSITLYNEPCKKSEILFSTNKYKQGKLFSHKGDWIHIMLKDNEGKEVYGWIYPVDE